jgi:cytochrome c-type biogenesis protein
MADTALATAERTLPHNLEAERSVLGSILALAGSSGSVMYGAALLLVYSLGLGVPFVLVAVLFGRITPLLKWLNRHSLVINRVAGVLLMVVGLLIFTGQLGRLATWMTAILPSLGF